MKSPGRKEQGREGRRGGGEGCQGGAMEGAAILSELHPVAAGVYNTAVFVIIPHRQRGHMGHPDN